jgi:hypothetical protein
MRGSHLCIKVLFHPSTESRVERIVDKGPPSAGINSPSASGLMRGMALRHPAIVYDLAGAPVLTQD